MWITFLKAFDWSPAKYKGAYTLAFPIGTYFVTRECAAKAFAAGAARKANEDEVHGCRPPK